jgi:imidazolonepropionase-like amidohydrolase
MVKALHDAKIQVVVGTDALAGLMVHHELALFVRAGLSPADALRAATIEPARAMKLDKKTGTIAAGKAADLVVIDGDPLARIDDIGRVVTTVRSGVVFASAPLYAAVGVSPR